MSSEKRSKLRMLSRSATSGRRCSTALPVGTIKPSRTSPLTTRAVSISRWCSDEALADTLAQRILCLQLVRVLDLGFVGQVKLLQHVAERQRFRFVLGGAHQAVILEVDQSAKSVATPHVERAAVVSHAQRLQKL